MGCRASAPDAPDSVRARHLRGRRGEIGSPCPHCARKPGSHTVVFNNIDVVVCDSCFTQESWGCTSGRCALVDNGGGWSFDFTDAEAARYACHCEECDEAVCEQQAGTGYIEQRVDNVWRCDGCALRWYERRDVAAAAAAAVS